MRRREWGWVGRVGHLQGEAEERLSVALRGHASVSQYRQPRSRQRVRTHRSGNSSRKGRDGSGSNKLLAHSSMTLLEDPPPPPTVIGTRHLLDLSAELFSVLRGELDVRVVQRAAVVEARGVAEGGNRGKMWSR